MYYSREERRSIDRLATQLFTRRHAHLTWVARYHCRREADAEDALQEALAAFLTEYDPGGGAPALPWLTLYADPRVMPTWARKAAFRRRSR